MPQTGENITSRFAEVVVNRPQDKVYTYLIPPDLADRIAVGVRVRVPFGKSKVEGFCVGLSKVARVESVKALIDVLDDYPLVDEKMLRLTRWIADYYCCSWGAALESAVPGGVKRKSLGRRVEYASLAVSNDEAEQLISRSTENQKARARILGVLLTSSAPVPTTRLLAEAGCSASPVKTLAKQGVVQIEKKRFVARPFAGIEVERTLRLSLTDDQAKAFEEVRRGVESKKFGVAMLHGVTGSGKTEIYLQAIDLVLKQGRQAIVLVPEISLTPQTVMRFRERFDDVAVLHGMMSDSQRHEQWRELREGAARIVIGARSAIFAPVPNLGLVVVDEEHETSFKQPRTPRYNARDVAVVRATFENAYVILGSATPSLETYYNALMNKYARLELPVRVEELPMPKVELVDMREEARETKKFPLVSRRLGNLIKETLSRKEQVLLFLNRRGFATYIDCPHCGFVLRCKRCDVTLTYHKKRGRAVCHYCNTNYDAPEKCPVCTYPLRYFGTGTEKIDALMAREFPGARLLRMDSDTMTGRTSHETAFKTVASGDADILLGTQMIAKGLHFPNVTLVGIVLADTPLYIPDFRSAERAFQLISQVAGRTGRSELGGLVIVQTFKPEHYSIQMAARHDYDGFARTEMQMRRDLGYPPYSRLVRFIAEGKRDEDLRAKCGQIRAALKAASLRTRMRVVGPASAPIARIGGKSRRHLLAMTPTSADMRRMLADIRPALAHGKGARVIIDVDPVNML